MEESTQTKAAKIVMVKVSELRVPVWNPRKMLFESEMDDLVAYIQAGGMIPKIWLWKGGPQGDSRDIIAGRRSWRLTQAKGWFYCLAMGVMKLLSALAGPR